MAKSTPATTAETKEVVKKEEAALPVPLAELEAMSGFGFEGADKDAYAIPFLRILQTNSPQCNEDEASYINGAKAGMFFNTITGQLFGKEVLVIPVHYGRDFIEWAPNRGGFIKAHGSDPKILDRVKKIDDKNNQVLDNGNIIQDTRNHYVLIAEFPELGPVILSLTSTGVKHSRKWMTLMNNLRIPNSEKSAPMFAAVWSIQSLLNENDEGKWYQIGSKSSTAVSFKNWVNKKQLDAAITARSLITSGEAKAAWDSVDEPAGNGGTSSNRYPEREPGSDEIPF